MAESSGSEGLFEAQPPTNAPKQPVPKQPPPMKPIEIQLGAQSAMHKDKSNDDGYAHHYNKVNQASPAIDHSPSKTDEISRKKYSIVCYQITMHLLLLYCVVGVTYLLFVQDKTSPFYDSVNTASTKIILPTLEPTLYPTLYPTYGPIAPSNTPTTAPTRYPSLEPTLEPTNDPTTEPTLEPTHEPTQEPTTHEPTAQPTVSPTETSIFYVGDYKISAQNSSHDHWLLCDASEVFIDDYPLLYNVISSSFGLSSDPSLLFKLPNAVNNVMAIISDTHDMGDVVGQETIVLNQGQLPSHTHFMMDGDTNCVANAGIANAASFPYLATTCEDSSHTGDDSRRYRLTRTNMAPNSFLTSGAGSNQEINIIQPTIYVGNLFIYGG